MQYLQSKSLRRFTWEGKGWNWGHCIPVWGSGQPREGRGGPRLELRAIIRKGNKWSSIPLITLFCKQNSLPSCLGTRFCSAFLLPLAPLPSLIPFPLGHALSKSSPWMEQTHPSFLFPSSPFSHHFIPPSIPLFSRIQMICSYQSYKISNHLQQGFSLEFFTSQCSFLYLLGLGEAWGSK